MAQAKQAQVIITANASVAERVMQELEGAATRASNRMKSLADAGAQIKERMRQLAAANKQNTDEYKQLDAQLKQNNKDFKAAEKEFQAFNSRLRENVKDSKRVEEVMKQLATTATRDLRRAFQAAKRELEKMSEKDPRRQQLIQDMKKIQQQIDTNTGAIKKQQGAWGALGTTMKNLFAYAGIFSAFNRLKGLFEDVIQKNREMSDQLANIRKVSGLAMSDINGLAKNLAKIDTRTSVQGLNDLAYVGAKLGFGNLGTEALESFVKSALKVENALKEDLGEDSMMAISKLVEVMGLIPKMGVEKAMDSAGSAIFKLASTSTATGANIIEFSKRLMGLANVSHITTDQLLALGSASDAMGLMPEVSATAFNKVFTSIQSNTKAIEQSLQMQKGELTALINEGKTMEAIVTVFDKMHGMNMDELKSKGVFKALGSDGARLNNVMITMSDRIDMLKTHLHTSSQAFSEGSAVAQEYAIQMETAEAYMQRAANMWEKAFVNPEGVDLTKEFAKAWYDVSKSLTQTETNAAVIKIILQGIFGIMKLIVEMIPTLITGFATWGLWAGGAALLSKLKEVGGLLSLISTAVRGMSFAGWAGIIAGVAMGVATLYSHFKSLNEELQRNSEFMKGFKKDLSDLNTEYGKGEAELRRYKRAIDEANKGSKQRQAAIQTFNSKFGQYMKNLLTEKSTAIDVANAYNEVTKALRAKLALQLKEKDINEQVLPREQWRAERRTEYEQRAQAAGLGQYGADWITGFAQDNQGKNINDLVRQIGKQYYNLPQQIIDEVATQAAAGNREFNNYGNIINSKYLNQANALLAAGSFLRQDRSAENAMRKVNKKWKPEQDAMDDYLANQNKQEPITPIEDRLTKEEIAAAKKAESEAKQALRKEMEDMQKQSTGIISKIEEWYRLQEAAINEARADGQLTEDQAAQMVTALSILKNESLSTARRAVTTGETAEWDEMKKNTLPKAMSDMTDLSVNLLKEIQEVPVEVLHKNLAKFNGDPKKVFGLDSRAFFDQMNAKAAGNQREAARLRAKLFGEAEKMLKQYELVEQATDKMQKDLETMGFVTESYEEFARRMQLGIMERPDRNLGLKASRREEIIGSYMSQYGNATPVSNTGDAEQLQDWLNEFTEGGKAKWAVGLPAISDWLKDANGHLPEIRRFYETLAEIQRTAMQREMQGGNPLTTTTEQNAQFDDLLGRRMSDKEAFSQMGMKFVGQGTIPYRINIENAQEAVEWLRDFATSGKGEMEDWAKAFPDTVGKWMKTLEEQGALDPSKTIGEQEVKSLEDALPQIKALFYKMENYSSTLGSTIEKQVQDMTARNPIGIDEMRLQYEQRRQRTEQLYNDEIAKAGENAEAVAELEAQKNQALIALDEQWRQQVYQIREQMGWVTLAEQYDNEVAMYQNMLNKKLISEKEFQQKKAQIQMKSGLQQAQMYNQQMSQMVDSLRDYEIQSTENKYDAMIQAAQKNGEDTTKLEEEKEAAILEIKKKYAAAELMMKIAEIGINTAAGIMQAWVNPGYPGAIPLTVMIAALGAAQTAMAIAEYQKAMGASVSGKGGAAKKVKLASGMLTYDEGNVQTVIGDDGRVYRAREQKSLPDGVGIVKSPIATTVNGQSALVGERGPEIVIGRKTTRAIQMNRPDLLRDLVMFDRGMTTRKARAFDEGNIQDLAAAIRPDEDGKPALNAALQDGQMTSEDARALTAAIGVFAQTVAAMQKNGIPAKIQKYGTGGLIDEVQSGLKFVNRYKG